MTKGWKRSAEKPKRGARARLLALCLLAAAGFLLWREGYVSQDPPGTAATATPLPEAETPAPGGVGERTVREAAYDKDMAALGELAGNQAVSAQTREDAARQMQQMAEAHGAEVSVEAALTAAGFSPCLVLLQNGALTVMVEKSELTAAESATILSLCAAHVDVGAENIRIMTGR